jgi:hypothetical protein
MPDQAVYADAEDLQAYWRPLSAAEQARANVLFGAAADLINEQRGSDTFVDTAKHWVSLDMVKRAMISAADGVRQLDQAMAGITANQTFVNPTGALYLLPAEIQRLNGWPTQTIFSVHLKSNSRVPLEPWNYQQSSQSTFPTLPDPFPYPYYPYPYYPFYS